MVVIAGAPSWGIERSSRYWHTARPVPWGWPLFGHGVGPATWGRRLPRRRYGSRPPDSAWSPRSDTYGCRCAAEPPHPGAGRQPAADRSPRWSPRAIAGNPDLDLGDGPELALVLGLAVALTILVNVFMLQRRFRPLERLIEEMEKADLCRPGANLRRLDRRAAARPRRSSASSSPSGACSSGSRPSAGATSSAALQAQEEERARVARDLHDEVNQSLTGLLLRLEAAREKAPPELAPELAETKALANQAMEELLTLARQLRPTALDDLGLKAALAGQVERARPPGRDRGELRGARATSPTSADRRPARRLPGRPGGALQRRPALRRRARQGPRCGSPRGADRRRADGRRRRPRLHLRRGRRAGWGSPGCASGRCWSAATSSRVAAERRNAGQPHGAAATSDMRRRHGASRKRSRWR